MKTFIYEMGIIDKTGKVHPVVFKQGLNVVTGKSSTGKSALIEIFDYCFASSEYTVPNGVITNNTAIYYVYLNVNGQSIVIGRLPPDEDKKVFFKREDGYVPNKINQEYFIKAHFIALENFKKHVRSLFLDIDHVDSSLNIQKARGYRAPTPSIRSFVSFILQHQNLIANKHALFYRFDEKEKRDQTIEHIKIFLNLVDQKFFNLSQEKERLADKIKQIEREQKATQKVIDNQKQKIEPILLQLYAFMGFNEYPVSVQDILRHPQDAKEKLNKIIIVDKINPLSDATTQYYFSLQNDLSSKTLQYRKLKTKENAIKHRITEEEQFILNSADLVQSKTVNIAKSVCPFCYSEHEQLQQSAEQLQGAIFKLSNDLRQVKPMQAIFQSELLETQRSMEDLSSSIKMISSQLRQLKKAEEILEEKRSLYESVITKKIELDLLIDSLNLIDDSDIDDQLKSIRKDLAGIEIQLKNYNYKEALNKATEIVNSFMAEIGKKFDFEKDYQPINLKFSFETFDLYHLTPKNEKYYLRSMGSGANWLYSHITLFLALHKYFVSLGEKCAIPSLLFLDQPTQVYFPNLRSDRSETFDKENIEVREPRYGEDKTKDDDIKQVENLFSQLSIYCTELESAYGFSPQIIVTDHADHLTLSDGTDFEALVNGNRWRTRGLIDPVPPQNEE